MPTTTIDRTHEDTYQTALGMLRRGQCSTILIAAYLDRVLGGSR